MENDFDSYIKLSAITTFQLFGIAFTGALCTYLKVFNNKDIEGLFSLINVCLLPMLMFVQILKGFDVTDIHH